MALKVLSDGTIVIRNMKDAQAALTQFQELKEARDEAYEESGIKEMDADLVALKASVTHWMVEQGKEQIECKGFHGTLIKSYYDAQFIGTKADLTPELSAGRKITPLRTIIYKKFPKAKAKEIWNRITKRVIVKSELEEVIAEGILSVDDVAPSFIEKEKTPYLRIFND